MFCEDTSCISLAFWILIAYLDSSAHIWDMSDEDQVEEVYSGCMVLELFAGAKAAFLKLGMSKYSGKPDYG